MNSIKEVIQYLKKINHIQSFIDLDDETCFRALRNITMPYDLSNDYYRIQDKILKNEAERKRIVLAEELVPIKGKICLWKGDITTIRADGIVNACNSALLGCFQPLHSCIDNAIHSSAGLQVRRDLMKIMEKQGHSEPNGQCKITRGYNLPSTYILHTVGPQIRGIVTEKDREDLTGCYMSCLAMAEKYRFKTLVFCSISTGIYGYPITEAIRIAVNTVIRYFENENSCLEKVIFNTFSEGDYAIYAKAIEESIR